MACGKISLIFVLLLLGVAKVVKGRKMITLTKEVSSVVEGRYSQPFSFFCWQCRAARGKKGSALRTR